MLVRSQLTAQQGVDHRATFPGCHPRPALERYKPSPASGPSLWFFTEYLVNRFSEFAVRNGVLSGRAGDLRLQVKHQRLQPVAAGLDLFDGNFQFADFGSQGCRDFLFIHDVDAGVETPDLL
jgi:hypothetical protein